MAGQAPRSLKYARALLIMMAIVLGNNTLGRLAAVQQFGTVQGVPKFLGLALLAIVGATYLLACVGAFFLLGTPKRLHWWLVFSMPVLAWINIAVAIAVIADRGISAGTVIDVYLFNGLLPLIVSGLLLTRAVRIHFNIARAAKVAKAA